MELEPRHIFFILFLSVTLMLLGGIGDGIMTSPNNEEHNETVFARLEHGDIGDRIGAVWDIFTINYDWLTPWVRYPFLILQIAFGILIARQVWKLVPIVGR